MKLNEILLEATTLAEGWVRPYTDEEGDKLPIDGTTGKPYWYYDGNANDLTSSVIDTLDDEKIIGALKWEQISTSELNHITPRIFQYLIDSGDFFGVSRLKIPLESDQLKTLLTNPKFIDNERVYTTFVKNHFKDNSVMMNKWLRYADNVRNME